MKKRIGIIGYGNMGHAIAQQLKKDHDICIFDKDFSKTKDFADFKVAKSITEFAQEANALILAVKPQDLEVVLRDIKNTITKNTLLISIAAGISTSFIESILAKARVIRVMPNMPAKIGKGMTCLCKGRFASDADLIFAQGLFDYLGKTLKIEEGLMNAATAISGSGPGYLYDLIIDKTPAEAKNYSLNVFMPSLKSAAETAGFSAQEAKLLAEVTTKGSLEFLKLSRESARELRNKVTSKGGTTEAGLEVLHRGGTIKDAVEAALKRAEELSSTPR